MHEFGIVQSLVQASLKSLEGQEVTRVESLHFRRGSAFSEEALRESFAAVSAGTALEGASLIIDTVNLQHRCACGRETVITSDDLIGHMYVCPACGATREVEESHDLELLEIVAEAA